MIEDAEEILSDLSGAVITGGSVSDHEGLHIRLEDGRILIFIGQFIFAVSKEQQTLQ